MRKRLLTLGALVLSGLVIQTKAQTTTTYVGSGAKFYVSSGALVYSGGVFKVDANTNKTVENRGDVIIVGNYEKGSTTGAADDGKEFVNVYTGDNDYGQVKIISATKPATGRMTMEKPAASNAYFGASYAVSFPYVDTVSYLMKSFEMQESDFRGDCPEGANCGGRYNMTLTKWNNNKLQHDAVPTNSKFKHGDYYNLNLRSGTMQDKMKNGNISYKGMPNGTPYTQTAKGVIPRMQETEFSNAEYNNWKNLNNQYSEKYGSYLGWTSTASKVYGKNVYRFGNPYTSNLDLSDVDTNAWLKIKNNSGNRTIKAAHSDKLIKEFNITKRASDYDVDWFKIAGGVNKTAKYHKAQYDGAKWTGSPEALLIRPLETFNLNFPKLNVAKLGNTRVVELEVTLNDSHKTFSHEPSAKTGNSSLNSGPTTLRTLSTNNNVEMSNNKDGFYQLEVFLIKDNAIEASPAYLVGSSYYKESGAKSTEANKIFVYGIKDDTVSYESEKEFNEFNSVTYVAKPMGIGFNNLVEGATYALGFNLYESSIFNKVKELKDGSFFLLDKKSDKVVKIDTSKPYAFVAGEDINNRFEVYWKESPKSIIDDIVEVVEEKTESVTALYKQNLENRLRFENDKISANVEVYDASGRLVLSRKSLPVDTDYTLEINDKGVYIIKVIYQNHETKVLKLINN